MNNEYTLTIYCAGEQTETVHTGAVDANGELIFACACGRFVKFPANLTTAEYQALIAAHKVDNAGQVSLQGSIDSLSALVSAGSTPIENDVTLEQQGETVEQVAADSTTSTVDTTATTTTSSTDATVVTVTPTA